MKKRNPQAGVTLLETLIGLLVMAMVAALLSAGFGTSTRFLNRSEEASDLVDQGLARRDLRLWFEYALPAPVPGEKDLLLSGSPDMMIFLTVPPNGMFWPGAATEVSLGENGPLVMAVGTDQDGADRRTSLTLAPPGTRLRFQYWGQLEADQLPDWHAHWPGDQGLPQLVSIAFDGGSSPPPTLTVQPGKAWLQSEMSLSSLVPPALPSRP